MRLVILDTGTLGLLTHPRALPDALACRQWRSALLAADTRVVVPGIADYELRRELIRARKTSGLRRLDAVRAGFEFDPVTQVALDKAAELWAAVRNAGLTTAHPAALDGDAILGRKRFWRPTRATWSRLPRTTPAIFPIPRDRCATLVVDHVLMGFQFSGRVVKELESTGLLSRVRMWVQATWHSPPGHSAPATQRPAEIPSRTIYGLIAYLFQIAERISSDPFDPPAG